MIRHRLKRLAQSILVLAMTVGLYTVSSANISRTSVDTNQPTTCTPVTETPYAGAIYQIHELLSDSCTDSLVPNTIYVVGTGLESIDNIGATNDEEQSIQSTTTDEYSMTIDDDANDIKDNDEAVEETVNPKQGSSQPQPLDENLYGVRQTEGESTSTTATLNSHNGRVKGPSGEETYYNLNMSYCVQRMQSLGYDYEYWVRDDGVKMFGPYVMVAADFSTRPLGTILETSLGSAIVVDTGDFVYTNPNALDVATSW